MVVAGMLARLAGAVGFSSVTGVCAFYGTEWVCKMAGLIESEQGESESRGLAGASQPLEKGGFGFGVNPSWAAGGWGSETASRDPLDFIQLHYRRLLGEYQEKK